ncbi:LacI family transcriptional regulator [Gluconacetobacter diazotrophicus]|uniref:LacI family transcriptional regulator n=1 Tax=Gluconacetobacter diazotrophicus TaxID=33996 RepID=A0A7W4I607_GLUDI|nr:LacI family transcriptional regulator [Gluconacetobacter diazotrophicus]
MGRLEDPVSAKPTILDVARVAGVSKSTVSLVLQKNPIVSEGARSRVLAAIRQVGYVYNRNAANLRQSRSNAIGIVVNDVTNSFFAEMAVGMDMIVQSAGFVQLMAHTGESVERQAEVLSAMLEHGVSGIILSPARGTRAADLKAHMAGPVPIVLAVRDLPGLRATTVVADNRAGSHEAARHLIGLGHCRIAWLGGFPDTSVYQTRLSGLRDAMAEAGLLFEEAYAVESNASRPGGVQAMGRLLDMPGHPMACMCVNDAVAFGACDGLRGAGLEPGRDFAIVGFDDVMGARTAVPALTTVATDPEAVGRRTAQILLHRISSGDVRPETITTPARLVVRASCGELWSAGPVAAAGAVPEMR